MGGLDKVLYSPALRMKAGELGGVRELASDVAAYILPRFIVPPLAERDDTHPELFASDEAAQVGAVPDVGAILARHWCDRRAFIDLTHLIDECGRDSLAIWLPKVFTRARSMHVQGIPMAMLSDLGVAEIEGFKAAINPGDSLKFGICVRSGDMVGPGFGVALTIALERLGLKVNDCAIIADFFDSDFSLPEHVAPIIGGALELLQDLGPWQQIIFQGTYYPEKNPADHGSSMLWPRNEWAAWRQAVKFDPATAEHMIFGDYAADCAKMVFGGSGAAAIRHYRYTTETAWLVERGAKSGSDKEIMQDVCSRIVASGHFAEADFSTADAYIYATAKGLEGPGNSTTWRQINTTHHITRVVVDVAKVRGIAITRRPAGPVASQLTLLPL
ncbi:beta family protein [Paraburkholderia sp. BL21I4N1]|uniref:beta family protein n=1 Tax=Paraburkholderia sp. BL21I4N1 TaxID=1938801 RepID=UPI000CFB96F9|nr:beta family protein [Paraburkholderia sp. BL21I4N1]PQV52183.1 T4 beta protein [Paraburkholderia sp. BL21I4N1]